MSADLSILFLLMPLIRVVIAQMVRLTAGLGLGLDAQSEVDFAEHYI